METQSTQSKDLMKNILATNTNTNTNTKTCAQRMERLLKIPGVLRASDLLSQARSTIGQPCRRSLAEPAAVHPPQTRGDAQRCIGAAVQETRLKDVRRFVGEVMSEPEVVHAITSKAYPGQPYPIELMARASRIAREQSGWMQPKRDILHAAVMLAGVREVLSEQVSDAQKNAGDVLFSIACCALHRLDDVQADKAHMLRLALGWGPAEDEDSEFAQELKTRVSRALAAVGMSAPMEMND